MILEVRIVKELRECIAELRILQELPDLTARNSSGGASGCKSARFGKRPLRRRERGFRWRWNGRAVPPSG